LNSSLSSMSAQHTAIKQRRPSNALWYAKWRMVLDSEVSYTSLRRSPCVGLLCNLMIGIGGQFMLLNSTGVIAKSQREEESALLRRKVEELNKNTAPRLIVEAGKLIQESKQLSAQVKSLETPARS